MNILNYVAGYENEHYFYTFRVNFKTIAQTNIENKT